MGIVASKHDVELLKAVKDLAEYLSEDAVATAMNVGNSFYLVAEEWERRKPTTREEIVDFYRTARAYLWNLTYANYGVPHQAHWRELARVHTAGKDMLDVGAGIGSVVLACKDARARTHADVGGVLTSYARWRYARNNLPVSIVRLRSDYYDPGYDPLVGQTFDTIVCTEVIEHVLEPELLACFLVDHLAIGGKLIATVSFEDDHGLFPCHLNTDKYTNDDFEERIFPALGLKRVAEELYEKTG